LLKRNEKKFYELIKYKIRSAIAELGLRRGMLLPPFLMLVVFVTAPAFADSIFIQTDKEQYFTDDSMTVSGFVENWKMPVIAMSIYDPNGDILSANSVEIQEDGTFSKTIQLDFPFYSQSGTYLITADYGQESTYVTFDVLGEIDDSVLEETIEETIIPEVTNLVVDKKQYSNNEFITISGTVSAIGDSTILVGIYDPSGFPAGFYTPEINQNLEFSTSFLARDGINFKTYGTYFVKAHYGESKISTEFDFIKKSNPPTSQEKSDNSGKNSPPLAIVIQPTTPKPVSQPIQTTQPIQFTPKPTPVQTPKQEKQDNLSVEDEELGKILNEITLSCDSSEFSDSIIYYDGMGPALMRLCKYNQALSNFEKSLKEHPNDVEILTNKGTAHAKLGHLDLAIANYDLVLKIKPNYIPALNNKANALAEKGEYEKAIEIYYKVLDLEPTYKITQTNLKKAQENLSLYYSVYQTESQKQDTKTDQNADAVNVGYSVNISRSPTIIDHIESVFASLFGFLT
jgi:tetratricopeptide (TPR) repeat protein